MKPIVFLAIAMAVVAGAHAQNVFVLGPLPNTESAAPAAAAQAPAAPAEDASAYYPPPVAVPPGAYGYAPYAPYDPYYPQYFPNVTYIGGPGTCGPTYYTYPRYSTPNVIYFGQLEAYRRGYHFRHCR